ncbi:hypothetical protein [Bradyrhizobium sp.]|uniref:hypothetical protein n=1 Tax=Bradyrhizobium sp. TaxID=376 RepID=UPI003C48CAF6
MRDVDAPPAARVAAANSLIDRGWGKAPQPLTGGDDEDNPIRVISRIERVIVQPKPEAAGDRVGRPRADE